MTMIDLSRGVYGDLRRWGALLTTGWAYPLGSPDGSEVRRGSYHAAALGYSVLVADHVGR